MKNKGKIVVLGDILYDCFVWADRLPRKGETVNGYDNGFFSGGKGANQAVQAAKLGAEVYLIGKVGDDGHGRFLLSELERYGVHTDYITADLSVSTGTCCVHVARDGSNAIIVAPMANEYVGLAELEKAQEIIERADVFISQLQLPPDVVKQGLLMAKKAGAVTILDPAPPRLIDDELLAIPDYFTPNETEAEFYTDIFREGLKLDDWCHEIGADLRKKGVQKLLLTLGSRGIFYGDGETSFIQECLPADTIDTTGAGDSFDAAFAVALAQGISTEEAVRYGNGAASLTTTKRGSQPAMPYQSEVEAYLAALK